MATVEKETGTAEGAVWIGVSGDKAQVAAAEELWKSLIHEPPCQA